jgi:hypothetical protein
MSTQDKTGDQLAETIRKAKAKSAPEKKRVPVKKAVATKKSAKEEVSQPAEENTVKFTHGRRVWPD